MTKYWRGYFEFSCGYYQLPNYVFEGKIGEQEVLVLIDWDAIQNCLSKKS